MATLGNMQTYWLNRQFTTQIWLFWHFSLKDIPFWESFLPALISILTINMKAKEYHKNSKPDQR